MTLDEKVVILESATILFESASRLLMVENTSDFSRKSLALYYFSKGRPNSEIDKTKIKNKTYFKDRFGFTNETFTENESLIT